MLRSLIDSKVSPQEQRLLWYSGTAVTLCLISVLGYGASLRLPFVQDDWHVLYAIKTTPAAVFLADAFWPIGKLLYRPLGSIYFLLLFKVFGLNPLAFHIVALTLHTLNGLLVVLIADRLTGRMPIATATGVLFVGAVTIQTDPLLWMVGFYDLSALCLFFTAFLFYLRGRTALSASAFLFALLAKESAASLIAVFLLHALILDRSKLRSLRPHLMLFALYLSLRILGWSHLPPDPARTYEAVLSSTHLFNNVSLLARWHFEVLFPWWTAEPRLVGVAVTAAALLALVVLLRGGIGNQGTLAPGLFLLGWVIAGLIAVVFLRHQVFRYYASTSLAPFLLFALLFGRRLLSFVTRLPKAVAVSALAVFVLANIGANVVFQTERFQKESTPSVRVYDGTNHLIRKGAIVRTVQNQMLDRYPLLKPGVMIVLGGIDRNPFAGSLGPRLWYNDTTIDVCTREAYDSVWSNQPGPTRGVLFVTFRADTLIPEQ